MNKQKYICPICGYDRLDEPAYDENSLGSFDICPCCGNEFGFDDMACGKTIEELRTKWLKTPKGLLKRKQLKNLENPEMQSILTRLGNRKFSN